MSTIIAPSILSANFGQLEKDIEMINQSAADWFHVDIMDGVFVPNISFGFPILSILKKKATKPLDVHLMIVQPEKYITSFAEHGASTISVHYEACTHLHRTIHQIKDSGCKAGVAINPHTSISLLEECISDIDMICLMSVNPGFGGQKFIEHTYSKVERLKNLILQKSAPTLIEIDGGVNDVTGPRLVASGADVLVAGNYVFSSSDPIATIANMKK
ncbi:MAG: ribulose-phosphate 3-epimerase [Cytophagaceae bacterium]|jgi:ribulose-phosphate 3-epimerase|nr:ribulose-phosphate 3-epimerase [Cytophagaceae bacterium]